MEDLLENRSGIRCCGLLFCWVALGGPASFIPLNCNFHKIDRFFILKWVRALPVLRSAASRMRCLPRTKSPGKRGDSFAVFIEEETLFPALQAQLKDVRSALDNLMKAIEKGVFTRTTKARLEELEAEEERLIKCIQEEEAKIPKISKEMILYTLYKYRDMDMRVQKNRERLIDGFVKAIIVYDDYFKVHLTYTDEPIDMPTTEEIEFMDQSSDIASAVSPKKDTHHSVCVFFCRTGIERPLKNMPVACF